MAGHHQHLHRRGKDADPSVSIVYVTASATFTGEIGGYTTLGVPGNTENSGGTKSADPSTSAVKPKTSDTDSVSATKAHKTATSLSTSTLPAATTSPATSSLALAAASIASTASSTLSAATESSSASGSTSTGMSAGGKAGLAIGILLLIGAVLGAVLFCFKKRRQAAEHAKLDDEKHEFASIAARSLEMQKSNSSTTTTTPAPRLSLRPVTQFMAGSFGEKRQSRGNALNVMAAQPVSEKQNAWDRPSTSHSANKENPFGNHAETIDSTNANGPAVVEDVGPSGEIVAGAVAGATLEVAAANISRGASKHGPKPIDLTKQGPFMGPPSPAGTDFSVNSQSTTSPAQTAGGAAIVAAGGPANTAVHRVQLDFKPSMDDELELHAGELIRLLHEYDDGWAMCIRLDRSRQGVVPRTCLSTRPVKPRPQQNGPRGPPVNVNRGPPQGAMPPSAMAARPMTPNGQPPRAMTPNGQQQRPMTPNGGRGPMAPRPMTPQGPMTSGGQIRIRSNSEAPLNQQARPRSNSSASLQPRRLTPPGQSPINPQYIAQGAPRSPPQGPPQGPPLGPVARKPIPGQAL